MSPSRLGFYGLTLLLGMFLFAGTALACCPPVMGGVNPNTGVCADGSQANPCCGDGSCNFFCCNCDGGCRAAASSAAETDAGIATACRASFDAIDTDHSGTISLKETKTWAKGRKISSFKLRKGFRAVDKNHNGTIDPAEFDRKLANAI